MTKWLVAIQFALVVVLVVACASPAEIAIIGDRLLVELALVGLSGLASIACLVFFLVKRLWIAALLTVAIAALAQSAWHDISWRQVQPMEHAWNWARSFVSPACRFDCTPMRVVSKLEWGGEMLTPVCRDRLYVFSANTPPGAAKAAVSRDIQIDNGTGQSDLSFRSLGSGFYSALSCDPW